MGRIWLVMPLIAACYDPRIPSGGFSCSAANQFVCPEGMHCDMSSGLCVRGPASDGSANPDGPISPALAGCSDGTREALGRLDVYPGIAACDGAWSIKGVVQDDPPNCNRQAGNTGQNPSGTDCKVSDLCAAGWHVCTDLNDVSLHMGGAACGELMSASTVIYVTRQHGAQTTGLCVLASMDSNNVYGCGGLGLRPLVTDGCAPLNAELRAVANQCPPPWDCGTDSQSEGSNVIKTAPTPGGGALCCHD